eukprot:scaffold77465_cov43-Attheya_sp.AAC.1
MAPSTATTAPNVTPIRSRLEDDDTWTLHVGNGDALVSGAQIAHGGQSLFCRGGFVEFQMHLCQNGHGNKKI